MCGIIAVARRTSERTPPDSATVLGLVQGTADRVAACTTGRDVRGPLEEVASRLVEADGLLRGTPGVRALLADGALVAGLEAALSELAGAVAALDRRLDDVLADRPTAEQEAINSALVAVRDGAWAIGRDRLRTARAVAGLTGPGATSAAVEAMTSVQLALSALDRLEVRGRDSAGISILVSGHDLDLEASDVAAALAERSEDATYGSGSVRVAAGCLSFVYKAAAEIGELGDNSAALRSAIAGDGLLARAVAADGAEALVLGHTRWASVGIISQANAHPVNSDEQGTAPTPFVNAALNGDIDNFADLKAEAGLQIAPEITTDAKVIPTLVSRALAAEAPGGATDQEAAAEAFRRTVTRFHGSVAIAASVADDPHTLLLALRGSGQALYVGLADDLYLVASEPYGVVEECTSYLRMDGETAADAADPTGSRGQVVVLDARRAGSVAGIRRLSYAGAELPVADTELARAEVTTRDIDRGDHPHFLLKEISESPLSFRKTLRGKVVTGDDGSLEARLGPETLPDATRAGLAKGTITRVIAIGQGTAAVAGQALAATLAGLTAGSDLRVDARLATELSGFSLQADMADTLIVAVSQSGTTTDTNRTVDLARSRGATVVSIVNRRGSDLTDRSDGVLYTSDGRDVEMSVASTKAFYAQVAAGILLGSAIAAEVDGSATGRATRSRLLTGLRALPEAMEEVLATRPAIAAAAQELAPSKRYWAIVGSGADRIAAQELRIKLSELCYKAIACDATEDKKHIDLSSEPLIIVCAAGLQGSNADDVAKEVAIYRAHKASPIVIASEGDERFSAALKVLTVPVVDPALSFVLATVVGHLWGYEAALAIDASALPLRQARAAIEARITGPGDGDGERLLADLRTDFTPLAARFFDVLRSGGFDGTLEAATAVRLASLMRYATGLVPLESFDVEHGRAGSPVALVEDLTSALTDAIEELTRPVDAIKHQAKTVTVGISRSDEGLLQLPLVAATLAAGAPRDRVSYKALRTLAGLDAAVAEVTGHTRYAVEGSVETHEATVRVIDRGGISRDLPLRTVRNPVLRGTKHRVAMEREVTVAVGRSDGRTVIIVPEVRGNECTGLTLLHCRFHERLPAARARSVLEQYRTRLSALHDAVTETEPTFRDDLLGEIPMIELLTSPVYVLAERWRTHP
ncbi:SIS domain-containing protein [Iamia sp. SCSIO 61187]|uniref:SIS domain-containing protein n=1 Tax=Iamia sp. SCSIO 61187 TaxID=2722752 RepID=UPI001C62C44E|nr:SIS domain-containing protein [Iamia sp. SCSIO 61187]QYG91611.1 SIS domain-containing protein [Iamia sp. SCSIO 61187]